MEILRVFLSLKPVVPLFSSPLFVPGWGLGCMHAWNHILSSIEKRVSPQNFDLWFRPTSLAEHDPALNKLLIRVPNNHFRYWLAQNYSAVIRDSLEELALEGLQVVFVVGEKEEDSLPLGRAASGVQQFSNPSKDAKAHNLNPRYTFDTFVVGLSNQLAHAASIAVAEQPSKAYNPLFLYGGVGLGKTHLMHAIGHSVKSVYPQTRLAYISSEHFMNELINAIRYDRTPSFREKYRNIDVLLMDDIQFLAGKERTQEEFFHTFNSLYDAQKQIVISSDSPPREIPTLEERLHSRFEWGLLADIQPPDLETKVAILRKKAELHRIPLPDDVALFVCSNTKSNIRELEGALIRLTAYSSLTGENISLDLAQLALKNLTESSSRIITSELVQRVVARHFSLKPSDFKLKNNSQRVAQPRQIAMFLSKELTGNSLPQIGRDFGGRHHTTVLHAVRKIQDLRSRDPQINNIINKLIDSIT